jgi:glucose uptake protein GlcU
MKTIIKQISLAVIAVEVMVTPVVLYTLPVAAAEPIKNAYQACEGSTSPVCASADDSQVNSLIKTLVNTLLFVLGAIAVIMIVVGGIRYTTSNGDSSAITSAKNTILYSVVGLVVAMSAYAIVNFVIERF